MRSYNGLQQQDAALLLTKIWFIMQEAEASSSAHAASKAAQQRHIVQLQASLLRLISWHDCC